jgi:hypothetical protein
MFLLLLRQEFYAEVLEFLVGDAYNNIFALD